MPECGLQGMLLLCFRLAQPVLGRTGWVVFTRRLPVLFLFYFLFLPVYLVLCRGICVFI